MSELKPLSKEAIPKALEKAVHYRLLNEPWQAESICRDILLVEPNHQQALLIYTLSLTDQFGSRFGVSLPKAREVVARLEDAYQRDYYKGLVFERQATAALRRNSPRAEYIAFDYLKKAMEWYEKADELGADDNEEAILRWNACLRMITQYKLKPAPEEDSMQPFLDV